MRLSALSLSVLVALLTLAGGCESKKAPTSGSPTFEQPLVAEVTESFMVRATTAFADRLKPTTKMLEIRVTGESFSVHMQTAKDLPASDTEKSIPAGSLVQLDYIEIPGEDGQPPIGRIRGPVRVPVKGKGEVKDNLFPFSDVDLKAIGRSLRIAILAIDPKDGKVTKLVVRRNLPFGKRVRGRIFVDSPRMGGTIDVNEKGTPLKR